MYAPLTFTVNIDNLPSRASMKYINLKQRISDEAHRRNEKITNEG